MAKRTRKKTTRKEANAVTTQRRITTRRTAAAPRAPRATASADRARTRAPERAARGVATRSQEDRLEVTLDLRDVAGRLIRDPETFFTFRRLSDNRQVGDQVALPVTGSANSFSVPVTPGAVLTCEIDPKRYRFVQSPVFFGSSGPPVRRRVQLLREPLQWTPRFTRWSELPRTFETLRTLLRTSADVSLFRGSEPLAPLLVDAGYDDLSAPEVTLAKTSLLNTYFRLNRVAEPASGQSWFSFVRRLLEIGRERILAFVDPEMEDAVATIAENIDRFRGDYENTAAGNHRGNVPAAMRDRITRMVSIKSSHDKGNFQLTITHLSGPDEVLLDADIDENGDLFGHLLDLFKHKRTGGTHPHDIHEILTLQEGSSADFDLGYRLA